MTFDARREICSTLIIASMTLDDKIDFILNKLNGSEGSILGNDIQIWLPEGQANPVDNQLVINELQTVELIRLQHPSNTDTFVITAKGRRINNMGGWNKFQTRERRNRIIKDVITYANIAFAAINIVILVLSLYQDKAMETEVVRLRMEVENQHELRNLNGLTIDSLKAVVTEQAKMINRTDSIIRKQKATKLR